MDALAILDGVRLAIDQGYQNVEVESDVQEELRGNFKILKCGRPRWQ
jgi:hypothetical protein